MLRYSIIILVLLFASESLLAQEPNVVVKDTLLEQQLDEVIVTATRTARQLASLPLPAQIIKKNAIAQINSMRLDEILNEQTGLVTVQNFIGGEGVQMQGLDSEYTLILIDGVPLVGRSAGTLDISRLAVGNIKQIEIIKGPSSSLYGSEALGGVINIITDNTRKNGWKGDVNHRFGTFNTNDTNINLDYNTGNFKINTFVNRNSSDGYNLANASNVNTLDPYVNYTFNTKINYKLSEPTNALVSLRYFTQDQDYIPTTTEEGTIKTDEWNAHLKLNHTYSDKWSSYFEFYATRYQATERLNSVEDGNLFSESDYDELLIRPEIRATYKFNENHSFIGGIGMDHETLERMDFSKTPVFNSPYAYLQYDGDFTDKLNVILGARIDAHNEYESQFSPKVAFRYELNDKLAMKGSVGYGFKAPDFRQLYFDLQGIAGYTILGYNVVTERIPELINNGEIESEDDVFVPLSSFEGQLRPESSIGYNFGVDYAPNNTLKFSLNLFRNDLKDLIDTQAIANKINGSQVFSYYNVNEAYTQGLEFNATWKPLKQLTVSGGYQLLYAKDKDAIALFENGEAFASRPGSGAFRLNKDDYFGLPNRSRHMANLRVFYTIEKWNADTNVRANYRSKYALFDTNGTVNGYIDRYDEFVDSYAIFNWAFNKNFGKNYRLGVGVDNIFDFKDGPTSQNDFVFIGNIPGRIIYTKLNIQF